MIDDGRLTLRLAVDKMSAESILIQIAFNLSNSLVLALKAGDSDQT